MSRSRTDSFLHIFCISSSLIAFAVLAGICYFLLVEAWAGIAAIGITRFFTDSTWYPEASGSGTFAMFPMLIASLLLGLSSAAIATPVALAVVIFSRFYAGPRTSAVMRSFVEVLGAVPSVVFGLIGLTMLVPLINRWEPPGTSLLAGILVLVPMILPTIAIIFDAALERLSKEIIFSAAALGLSRVSFVLKIIIPALRPTILTGCMLALARALGETMAVLMVTGNVIQLPSSIAAPVRALTSNIALEMPYALGVHRSSLFFSGLLMIALTVSLFLVTRVIASKGWQQGPVRND